MITLQRKRLSRSERAAQEAVLATSETVGSLRNKRRIAAFKIGFILFCGVGAVLLLSLLLFGDLENLVPRALNYLGYGGIIVVCIALLAGRGAERDYEELEVLKADARKALDSDGTQQVELILDEASFIILHDTGGTLITGRDERGSMAIPLKRFADTPLITLLDDDPTPTDWTWHFVDGKDGPAAMDSLGTPRSLDRLDATAPRDWKQISAILNGKTLDQGFISLRDHPGTLRKKIEAILNQA